MSAQPQERDDYGNAILPPIVYERTEHGWRVPDSERATWDALEQQRENRTGIYAPRRRAGPLEHDDAPPVQHLVAELESWLDLDTDLEQLVRDTYDREPGKTSRLVRSILDGARAGRLRSPAGLLVTRLRKL